MHRLIRSLIVLCIICMLGLFSSGCDYDCMKTKVKLDEKVLCASTGVTRSTSEENVTSVDIPSGAAITKIHVSIWQEPGMPIDSGTVTISGEAGTLFEQDFSKDPAVKVGSYETTFVQPLCVGDTEFASARIIAYSGQALGFPLLTRITVIYCPDYCSESDDCCN